MISRGVKPSFLSPHNSLVLFAPKLYRFPLGWCKSTPHKGCQEVISLHSIMSKTVPLSDPCFGDLGFFSGPQKGPAERGHVKKRQGSSKVSKTFRHFSRRAKTVNQNVFENFRTAPVFRPFWGSNISRPFGQGKYKCRKVWAHPHRVLRSPLPRAELLT